MNRLVWVAIVSVGCVWGQSLDLSSLDKLEAKAKSVNRVTLDGNQLRAAMQMVPQDAKKGQGLAEAQKVLPNLQSVLVRNYEFAEPGQYRDSDLDAVRSQVEKMKGWVKIVESKEKNEHSEVFMFTDGDKPSGIAVISAEPKEISVVLVRGPLNFGDLGKLHGLMGVPNVDHSKKEDKGKTGDH
jgi:hypothetical protein